MNFIRHQFHAMGCPCEFRLYVEDDEMSERVIDRCVAETLRFDAKYSRYRADSVTSTINQSAGHAPVTIDPETASILKYSGVCYVQSNGLFDITSGVLRQVWLKDMTELPTDSALETCLEKVGWEKIGLNDDSVHLPLPGMELDFGGVVKEYAADAIAATAQSEGVAHGLINLGGDIRVIGPRPDGSPWPVGIVHPTKPNHAIATIALAEGALTTSGGYERFFEINGQQFSHLINPKTGWPVDSLYSASVAAPQAVVAGSLTSIALLQSPNDGVAFLEECDIPFFAVDQQLNCYGHLGEAAHA